ncbi:uncharacterized protein V6R79_009960 [Siganus canaliculatus]
MTSAAPESHAQRARHVVHVDTQRARHAVHVDTQRARRHTACTASSRASSGAKPNRPRYLGGHFGSTHTLLPVQIRWQRPGPVVYTEKRSDESSSSDRAAPKDFGLKHEDEEVTKVKKLHSSLDDLSS